MSRDINDLSPEFKSLVEEFIIVCEATGYPMRPFYTLRTPFEQAKLWRQSRSKWQIENKVQYLKDNGADFLAYCIESVGPQYGRHVTNAMPGLSWHQWGEAIDCYWLLDEKAEWSARRKVDGKNGYKNYAEQAESMGLNAGGNWKSFKDWVHVQMRPESNPGKVYTLQEINEIMEQRFGD